MIIAKAKKKTILICLESKGSKGIFKIYKCQRKNKKVLSLKKYDKNLRKRVLFVTNPKRKI